MQFGIISFSVHDFICSLIPIWFGYNWFISCYTILYIFIPYINIFIYSMCKKKYYTLLIILFLIRYVCPLFGAENYMNEGHCLEQFIFMYLIGGYIRLWLINDDNLKSLLNWRIILVTLIVLMVSLSLGIALIGIKTEHSIFLQNVTFFGPIFVVIIPIALFMVTYENHPFYNNIINRLSSSVFGIYLLHDNPILRNIIWERISPNIDWIKSNIYLVHMIIKTIVIFCVCLVIDILRRKSVGKLINNFINKIMK